MKLAMFPNPLSQYSKRQTRAEEIRKCLDDCLEPTYYFSIFIPIIMKIDKGEKNLNHYASELANE